MLDVVVLSQSCVSACVDNESSASSRQSSSIRPTSSAAVTGSVATSAITLSRSASNASVKSLVSTDATKLPPAVADSCQHGKHCLKCVWDLFDMVFSVFVISEPKISVKNHVKSPCYLLH